MNLTKVSRTLLLPLIGRATNNILHDDEAKRILKFYHNDMVSYTKFCENNKYSFIWCARALFFDREINAYLTLNPKATIVSLGSGLDTTFYRVDNGLINWIDLDLSEVIELRKKLLTKNNQIKNIACSVVVSCLLINSNYFF